MPAVPAATFVVRYPDARFISAPERSAHVSKERSTVYHMAAPKKRLYHPQGNSPESRGRIRDLIGERKRLRSQPHPYMNVGGRKYTNELISVH